MRLLWLEDVLKAAGLNVKTQDGWRQRGSDSLDPRIIVDHHTASAQTGPNPSLGIVTNGRGEPNPVPGPLCNLLTGRDGTVWVIASGVSNNAGVGKWPPYDASHNRHTIGHEVEHAGTSAEPVRPEMLDVIARVDAAICKHLGWTADRCIAHKEWAPKRKVDPYWSQDAHRALVAALLKPPPVDPGVSHMDFIEAHDAVRAAYQDAYGHGGDGEGRVFWTDKLMREGFAGWAELVRALLPKGD